MLDAVYQPTAWLFGAIIASAAISSSVEAAQLPDFLTAELLQEAAVDMTLSHEATPHGTSSLDWSQGPRLAYGENPPADWDSTIFWGQVYEPEGGNPAINSRVQLRNLRLVFLTGSTGEWDVIQDTSNFDGAFFDEDFAGNDSTSASQRAEPEGGASIRLPNNAGLNYHFWSDEGRTTSNLGDIGEVIVLAEARLVLDDPNGPDDRDAARLMLSVGADYWENSTAEWDNWTTNGDVGIGRFEFITSAWQTYTMTTLTPEEVAVLIPEPSGFVFVMVFVLPAFLRRRCFDGERV